MYVYYIHKLVLNVLSCVRTYTVGQNRGAILFKIRNYTLYKLDNFLIAI